MEFRTAASADEPTAYPPHFRQHLDPDEVVAEIEQHGGTVVEREQGRGRAVLRDEDPDVCRLVVRWGGPRRPTEVEPPVVLADRVRSLEREVQRFRGRHQRVSDVLDLVTDVLVPATDPADPRLVEALAHLRRLVPES